MMKSRQFVLMIATVVVLAAAVSASAQTVPALEVSGGYQFLSLRADGESTSLGNGWYADLAANLTKTVGVVGQVGGNYRSETESVTIGGFTARADARLRVHEFLGGVRVNGRSASGFVPYGQVLVGAVNGSVRATVSETGPGGSVPVAFDESESSTNLGLQFGGGANVRFSDNLGLRVGADYLRIFADGGGSNALRTHVGLTIMGTR